MKFAVCLALIVFISLFSDVAASYGYYSYHRRCCSACKETRNVTKSAYVPDTVCPTVVLSEKRCVRRSWWGRCHYGTVYRSVSPVRMMDVVQQEQFCNTTCFNSGVCNSW